MRKEIIHIRRDPKTLMLVIIMPVMMLVLLGYAVTADIENIPLAVADLSKSSASQNFIDRYWISGFFEITHDVKNEKEILELIDCWYSKNGDINSRRFWEKDRYRRFQSSSILY
jgi:ABC-2 type transport system permease protein